MFFVFILFCFCLLLGFLVSNTDSWNLNSFFMFWVSSSRKVFHGFWHVFLLFVTCRACEVCECSAWHMCVCIAWEEELKVQVAWCEGVCSGKKSWEDGSRGWGDSELKGAGKTGEMGQYTEAKNRCQPERSRGSCPCRLSQLGCIKWESAPTRL